MGHKVKLRPQDLRRLQRERQGARGVACGRYVSVMGFAGVEVDVPGPKGTNAAHLDPRTAWRFGWAVIRAAVGAWWANVRGGKRNA
jgi:hypothetical protein